MVGSYCSTNTPWTYWVVNADLPTPPAPRIASFRSILAFLAARLRMAIASRHNVSTACSILILVLAEVSRYGISHCRASPSASSLETTRSDSRSTLFPTRI